MSLLANSNAIESGGYNIDRSLRFRRSASAYLNRTPAGAGNRKTYTWSSWVKRGLLGDYQEIFCAGSSDYETFVFNLDKLQFYVGGQAYRVDTVSVFRDPSAWYHVMLVVDTTQATDTNRIKIYVNNVLQPLTSTSYPPQNWESDAINTAVVHNIGRFARDANEYFDGYMAEVNFIDGQSLTPSSFGQTDTSTGVWAPKKYTGTYGTNGFYLPFSDNTSATTLAYDKSGNGNNWTANNISTTTGATYDSMTDVPTLTSATAANYATMNPIAAYSDSGGAFPYTIRSANLNVYSGGSTGSWGHTFSTIGASSGKWYFECLVSNITSSLHVGISQLFVSGYFQNQATSRNINLINGNSNSGAYNLSAFSANDVLNVAFDVDAGKVWFGKNGTWGNSGDPATATNPCFTDLTVGATYFAGIDISYTGEVAYNFGQRPFSYTPPTGFKALNTFNLPDPTIKKPNQYMDVLTYSGNGTDNRDITGLNFQPDFSWLKARNDNADNTLFDSVRGGAYNKALYSNSTAAEGTYTTGFDSFLSNGFRVDNNVYTNSSVNTYVAWNWKESATAGFDIVTYTGTGVNNRTVSHSLGVAPAMIIVKDRTSAYNWDIYHQSLGISATLTFTSNATRNLNAFGTNAPTSSVFYTQDSFTNTNGDAYVAYLFAEIPGFSKFGSYTGNGSTDGPFVYCGFRPKFIMVKNTTAAGNGWIMYDTSRNTYNIVNYSLFANESSAENATSLTTENYFDVLSNGFKARTSNAVTNQSGQTLIYAAFAENPFKYSNAR